MTSWATNRLLSETQIPKFPKPDKTQTQIFIFSRGRLGLAFLKENQRTRWFPTLHKISSGVEKLMTSWAEEKSRSAKRRRKPHIKKYSDVKIFIFSR